MTGDIGALDRDRIRFNSNDFVAFLEIV